jgi:hypothetical protein
MPIIQKHDAADIVDRMSTSLNARAVCRTGHIKQIDLCPTRKWAPSATIVMRHESAVPNNVEVSARFSPCTSCRDPQKDGVKLDFSEAASVPMHVLRDPDVIFAECKSPGRMCNRSPSIKDSLHRLSLPIPHGEVIEGRLRIPQTVSMKHFSHHIGERVVHDCRVEKSTDIVAQRIDRPRKVVRC